MEAEYTLPQHTSNMSAMPQEDHRRIAPEPYASSAIYTELNYQVHIIFIHWEIRYSLGAKLMSWY